jgi:hypothetical protein
MHPAKGTDNREKGTDNREKGTDNREKGTDNRRKGADNRGERVPIIVVRVMIVMVRAPIIVLACEGHGELAFHQPTGQPYALEARDERDDRRVAELLDLPADDHRQPHVDPAAVTQ